MPPGSATAYTKRNTALAWQSNQHGPVRRNRTLATRIAGEFEVCGHSVAVAGRRMRAERSATAVPDDDIVILGVSRRCTVDGGSVGPRHVGFVVNGSGMVRTRRYEQ